MHSSPITTILFHLLYATNAQDDYIDNDCGTLYLAAPNYFCIYNFNNETTTCSNLNGALSSFNRVFGLANDPITGDFYFLAANNSLNSEEWRPRRLYRLNIVDNDVNNINFESLILSDNNNTSSSDLLDSIELVEIYNDYFAGMSISSCTNNISDKTDNFNEPSLYLMGGIGVSFTNGNIYTSSIITDINNIDSVDINGTGVYSSGIDTLTKVDMDLVASNNIGSSGRVMTYSPYDGMLYTFGGDFLPNVAIYQIDITNYNGYINSTTTTITNQLDITSVIAGGSFQSIAVYNATHLLVLDSNEGDDAVGIVPIYNTTVNNVITGLGSVVLPQDAFIDWGIKGAICSNSIKKSIDNCRITNDPTALPTSQPSYQPSSDPSSFPSDLPTVMPSGEPSIIPSGHPSGVPSVLPTDMPTVMPTSGQDGSVGDDSKGKKRDRNAEWWVYFVVIMLGLMLVFVMGYQYDRYNKQKKQMVDKNEGIIGYEQQQQNRKNTGGNNNGGIGIGVGDAGRYKYSADMQNEEPNINTNKATLGGGSGYKGAKSNTDDTLVASAGTDDRMADTLPAAPVVNSDTYVTPNAPENGQYNDNMYENNNGGNNGNNKNNDFVIGVQMAIAGGGVTAGGTTTDGGDGTGIGGSGDGGEADIQTQEPVMGLQSSEGVEKDVNGGNTNS